MHDIKQPITIVLLIRVSQWPFTYFCKAAILHKFQDYFKTINI